VKEPKRWVFCSRPSGDEQRSNFVGFGREISESGEPLPIWSGGGPGNDASSQLTWGRLFVEAGRLSLLYIYEFVPLFLFGLSSIPCTGLSSGVITLLRMLYGTQSLGAVLRGTWDRAGAHPGIIA